MLIRKNTKAFKTILEIVSRCQDRDDREKLLRLYITKAGHTIEDRISIEGIEGDASLFYEMNFQAVLNNLKSSNHQLHTRDESPGVYFFHTSSNKTWDETPFEFDESVQEEFADLSDLPDVRKREQPKKYALPSSSSAPTSTKVKVSRKEKKREPKPKQPDYALKKEISFTDLDKVVFREPKLLKKGILDYYNDVAGGILPFLRDRPVTLITGGRPSPSAFCSTLQNLKKRFSDIPDWIQTTQAKNEKEQLLLCDDREHLLLFIELGTAAFAPGPWKSGARKQRDQIILAFDSPNFELGKTVDAVLATKEILHGLEIPSFVKSDGKSGLHVQIALDEKTGLETSVAVAEYLSRLVRLKLPDVVEVITSNEKSLKKVSISYQFPEGSEPVAPYSFAGPDTPVVCAPLSWDEVGPDLRLDAFTPELVVKRLKKGDPFQQFWTKRVNANKLLQRLEKNYSFLL